MSIFWSSWITVLSLACWAFILGVLVYNLRHKPDLDEEGTTGHVYDGIQEYDKPLPKWWLAIFFGTIVWAIGYFVFFPALFPKSFNGLATVVVDGKEVPWTSHNELNSDLEKNNDVFIENFKTIFLPNDAANAKLATLADLQAKYRSQPEPDAALKDEIDEQVKQLAPFISELAENPRAVMAGQSLFLQNCALCHGSNAQGAKGAQGYPNLTDNDWLHGGEPENILLTIHNGRSSEMPEWRTVFGEDGVRAVAEYTLSLSPQPEGVELDPVKVAQGKAIFHEPTNCVLCHGEDGKGQYSTGAPNLTDNIWLYGGDRETVQNTIRHGRLGVMPEWQTKLGNERIMLLAAYVYSLSHNAMESSASITTTE